VPVLLYGELTAGAEGGMRTRAQLRRGGVAGIARRLAAARAAAGGRAEAVLGEAPGEPLTPDFGPSLAHASAGVTLLGARPPLVAFNLLLAAPATIAEARAVSASIREGGAHGLPGVRAIGVELSGGVAQVSMNVERPMEVSLAMVVQAVGRLQRVSSAELVGLAPAAALEGFPEDLPMPGFDPARHIIENALGC
jgi:glutamate formiminotransferase / 5-formyltetrahydrofolate cyclo-ligase